MHRRLTRALGWVLGHSPRFPLQQTEEVHRRIRRAVGKEMVELALLLPPLQLRIDLSRLPEISPAVFLHQPRHLTILI